MIRVGRVGGEGRPALPIGEAVLVDVAPTQIAETDVDVWLVDASASVVEAALLATRRPILLMATAPVSGSWERAVVAGDVELSPPGEDGAALLQRVQGAVGRSRGWNDLCDRLATSSAHDLRSPLQGLRFAVAALERSGNLGEEAEEDLATLRAAADAFEVVLHGLYNLGRPVALEQRVPTDVVSLLREEGQRPFFDGRVQVGGAGRAVVDACPSELRFALLDVLRVLALILPGSRAVVVDVQVEGGLARVRTGGPVYPAVLPHVASLLRRDEPVGLRGRVRLPFAGLAYAADIARAHHGGLDVAVDGAVMNLTVTLPIMVG